MRPRGVGVAGPQVDDGVPVDVDGEGRAHLGAGGEDRGEGLPYPLESGIAVSVNDTALIVTRERYHAGA